MLSSGNESSKAAIRFATATEIAFASLTNIHTVLRFSATYMSMLALDLLNYGVPLSMICAVVGLVFAFFLIGRILKCSPGNERMRQISGAIQEGAKAYLNRQVMTISAIAAAFVSPVVLF